MTEAELIKKYSDQNIEVRTLPQVRNRKERVVSVRLSYTDSEWVDLLDADGESLGACCSTISSIRDNLIQALRDSKWMDVDNLRETAQLIEYHGCGEAHTQMQYLIKLWNKVRPDTDNDETPRPYELGTLDGAIAAVADNCGRYDMLRVFKNFGDDNHDLLNIVLLSRIVPAIGALYRHTEALNISPISAFAIFGTDGNVIQIRSGPAIFHTLEQATTIAEYLNEKKPTATVRPVTVSLAGINASDTAVTS